MKKRLVSAIICGAMVLSSVVPVFADGGAKIALVGKSAGNALRGISKKFPKLIRKELSTWYVSDKKWNKFTS